MKLLLIADKMYQMEEESRKVYQQYYFSTSCVGIIDRSLTDGAVER